MNAPPPAPRNDAARPLEVDVPAALPRKSGVTRWLKLGLNLVGFVFIALTARSMAKDWQANAVHISPLWALVALVPFFFSCFAQAFAWIALIERMAQRRVPRGLALSNYLASQLMRYTPGKVGLPLKRMEGADQIGVPRAVAGGSVLIEMLSWTATGAVIGFALVTFAAPAAGLEKVMPLAVPALVASALGLLVLLVVDRNLYPTKLRFLLGAEGRGPVIPYQVPLIQTGYWALVAVHGYLMSIALGASVNAAVTAMGLYVLSSVIGFVMLFAPGGLGIREGIISLGLKPLVGAAPAAAAALISRAASFIAEILVWAAVKAVVHHGRPRPVALGGSAPPS